MASRVLHTSPLLILAAVSQLILFRPDPLAAQGKLLRGEKWKKFVSEGQQADFYVSPEGDDSWSGTLPSPDAEGTDGPFATLHRARRAVRALKREVYTAKKAPVEKRYIGSPHTFGEGRDILVFVRGGYHVLEEPLVFTPEDGGERCETDLPSGAFEFHKLKDFHVTYAAYPGEAPVLSGGRRITSWRQQGGCWTATVEEIDVRRLVASGRMQKLARTPNAGYFTLAEIPRSTRAFKFRRGDLERWPDMEENRIIFLLRWHTGINGLARIDDDLQVAYLRTPQEGIVVVPPRYYVENVKALLDAPGEWFFDRGSRTLSYLPGDGIEDPRQATIVVPLLSRLVAVKGEPGRPVRNLRLYGLTLEATNPGDHAVSFAYVHGCELVDSRIQAVGGSAVHVGRGCYQTRIMGNTILGADGGGIGVDGHPHPEKWQDMIRETIITHNTIDDCGGRSIGARNSLYTTISRNEIKHNRGRVAISVGGWSNVEEAIDGGYRVEYNHVHHVQKEADDSGAITTAGLTYDSVVRGNLIHDVEASFFNENVAIWFDNMSSSWLAEENILYRLGQGEMKLCASNLVDNIYRDNHVIEAPDHPPEGIIDGQPEFQFSDLELHPAQPGERQESYTGDIVEARAVVSNRGATGIDVVPLYVDGKVAQSRKLSVIHKSRREITFEIRFSEPGLHRIAIGTTAYQDVAITGEPLAFLCESPEVFPPVAPLGETVTVSTVVVSARGQAQEISIPLLVGDEIAASKSIRLAAHATRRVEFTPKLPPGIHSLRIGNSPPVRFEVYPHQAVDVASLEFREYCSATAQPCDFLVDQRANRYRIQSAGTDFFHGEDSYGTIYLKNAVTGSFVATVKIVRFGERTHEWFRAGLFVRNDIAKSYDVGPGSLGSVLLFATPGRVGMSWDAYGDGRTEKASSRNHPRMEPYPMWLKLVRHANSFSGSISYDGQNWSLSRRTSEIPGLASTLDIGLAAGGPDQRRYRVEFADFALTVETPHWRRSGGSASEEQ